MSEQPSEQQQGVVIGWRDIAQYLGVSVATARRWQLDLGLPIANRGSGAQFRVYTSKSLIDKWIYARATVLRRATLERRDQRAREKAAENG